MFALMLHCGLRPGEAQAMTWNNIDLANKTLTVTQAVKKTTSIGCVNIKIGEPKTGSSARTISMPQALINLMKPAYKKGFGYVVPGQNGQPISEQRYTRAWASFYREMQINAGAKLHRNA
ncbi:MAG: tyrosine-type recombinase/integrase, partial [Clostridiales bacterium]